MSFLEVLRTGAMFKQPRGNNEKVICINFK